MFEEEQMQLNGEWIVMSTNDAVVIGDRWMFEIQLDIDFTHYTETLNGLSI